MVCYIIRVPLNVVWVSTNKEKESFVFSLNFNTAIDKAVLFIVFNSILMFLDRPTFW